MADLQTLRGIELVKTGSWDASTGEWTVTAEDLAAAIDAHRAGVLRKPVVKIGHEDPRFDGGPALGFVDNLRLIGATTLVGDLVNVPAPIARMIPHAYPDRSVEALIDYEAPDGTVWPLVLTAVALLGAAAPGVDTLGSLQGVGALYGEHIAAKRVALATGGLRGGSAVAQAVAVAAARRRRHHRILTQQKGTR